MSDEKTPAPTGYRNPGDVQTEPEYMTTVGVVHMRDEFDQKTKRYGGYHCTKAMDPILPPGGPGEWRLLSTTAHTAEFYESKPTESTKYTVCFIALIWTWQRVHES